MAWNDLSINQRSQLMNMFRKNGITSLSEMRRLYDLSSPLVETSQLSQTSVAPVYRKGGRKKPNLSPQGVNENSPEFVGPTMTALMNGPEYRSDIVMGPPVPYGFYDAPIDWNDIEARQHWAESRFKNKQRSGPGARGPFQIMPKTWDAYQKKLNLNGNIDNYNDNKVVRDALMNDLYNSRWATKGYPSDSVRTAKTLAAYNWGSGNLTKHLNNLKQQGTNIYHSMDWIDTLPDETRNYVNFILRGKNGSADLTNEAFQAALPSRFSAFPEVQHANGSHLFWHGGPINPKIIRTKLKNAALSLLPKNVSKGLASVASFTYGDIFGAPIKDYYQYGVQEDWNPEEGFLMSPKNQQKYMEEIGYHKIDDGSYGMVNKAATRLKNLIGADIPIYQLGDDDISPDEVTLVSTKPEEVEPYFNRLVLSGSNRLLRDPGSHPSALYQDKEGNYYLKSWDLNDYGKHGQSSGGTTYGGIRQALAEIYDFIGTPFVQRTGLIRVPTEKDMPTYNKSEQRTAEDMAKWYQERIANGEFSLGGKIHINPKNRGKFNATKKRTGKTTEELTHSKNPLTKKRAIFAQNAKKWHKKSYGGIKF